MPYAILIYCLFIPISYSISMLLSFDLGDPGAIGDAIDPIDPAVLEGATGNFFRYVLNPLSLCYTYLLNPLILYTTY
jgi:hypothetical protein